MNNFEKLKSMTVNEFAEWLAENCQSDEAPWTWWFDENYCKKCEPITCKIEAINIGLEPLYPEQEVDCAWCELHQKCKYFQELDNVPDSTEIIKMWLNHEITNRKEVDNNGLLE